LRKMSKIYLCQHIL